MKISANSSVIWKIFTTFANRNLNVGRWQTDLVGKIERVEDRELCVGTGDVNEQLAR